MSKQVEFSHREIPFGAYDQQSWFTLPAQELDNSATLQLRGILLSSGQILKTAPTEDNHV